RTRAFVTIGARLFELAPIQRVRLRGFERSEINKLAATPALAKVEELVLQGEIEPETLRSLVASPYLASLRVLDIAGCRIRTGRALDWLEKLPELLNDVRSRLSARIETKAG